MDLCLLRYDKGFVVQKYIPCIGMRYHSLLASVISNNPCFKFGGYMLVPCTKKRERWGERQREETMIRDGKGIKFKSKVWKVMPSMLGSLLTSMCNG